MDLQLDRFLEETVHKDPLPEVFLMVMNGPEDGRVFPIAKETVNIGRSDANEIALSLDPVVSRAHARLSREGDRFYIADLNSRFGTQVNGSQLNGGERRELQHGSAIQIGETQLEFRWPKGGNGP